MIFPTPDKIQQGTLIGYNLNKGPNLGIVTQNQGNTFRIFIKNKKEFGIKKNTIFLNLGLTSNLQDPVQMVNDLMAQESQISDIQQDFDLESLYELLELEEQDVFTLEELVTSYFGESYSHSEVMCLARVLETDPCYFKRKKDSFQMNPRTQVEAYFEQLKKMEEKREVERKNLEFLQSENPWTETQVQEYQEFIEQLKSVAIEFDDSPAFTSLNDILKQAGMINRNQLKSLLIEKGIFDLDTQFEILEAGYPETFSENFLNYIEGFDRGLDQVHFKDLRGLPTYTIDGESTRDRDDAFSWEEGVLYVHIANMAAVIGQDARIQKEALKRLTSLYLPDAYYSMLPDELIRKLSLDEGEERFAITLEIRDIETPDFDVYPSLIKVDKNYSYEEVDKSKPLFDPAVFEISEKLYRKRLDNDAVQYHQKEYTLVLPKSEEDKIQIADRVQYHSQKFIAELSIFSNSLFALFCDQNSIPILFRTQTCQKEKLLDSEYFAHNIHCFFEYYRLKRFLGKTAWEFKNRGHASLGVSHYTQMTSPIRRFMDYLNQWQLWTFLCESSEEAMYSQDEMDDFSIKISTQLYDFNSIQNKRQKYFLLKYFAQEIEDGRDFETEAMPLDVSSDAVLFHLPEFEQIFRWKSSRTSELKAGVACKARITTIDLIERDAGGVLEAYKD